MDSNTTFLFDVSEIDNVLVDQTIKDVYEALEEKYNIEVILQDERLSSVEANNIMIKNDTSRKKRKKSVDSLAANIILQSYLDKIKKE